MATRSNRGSVAVVGVAESDIGLVGAGTTAIDLMAQAAVRAVDDAGISLSSIDGVFATTSQSKFAPTALAEYLGLQPRFFDGTNIGGSSFMTHVAHAQAAIEAGECSVALIAHGSTQRSLSRAVASPREPNPYEDSARAPFPVAAYALAASRHMHEFGTTREQLAEVAVAARAWALLNPRAWEKEALTIPDVLASRLVASPLTIRDCCLVTDGGGAMIVVRSDQAKAVRVDPVYILGTGGALSHISISNMPSLVTTAAVHSGEEAFRRARLSPQDVSVLGLYDAFSILPILLLEDLGFCAKGEGGAYVGDGAIAPGGRLPVNTNGGGLSYCHPGMYGLLAMIEVVRQIRGECGARQVRGCDVGLAHGNGGVLSSQCTVIFGSAATI